METLPNEILLRIAELDIESWAVMTAIPTFGRLSLEYKNYGMKYFTVVNEEGLYRLNGKLFRLDGPAIVEETGGRVCERWFEIPGKLHRRNGPALLYTKKNNTLPPEVILQGWYREGKRHRDNDLPAVEELGGATRKWYNNDELHRDNDLPALVIETKDGLEQKWYKHGKLHREEGPAVVITSKDGLSRKEWRINDELHRDDGPAFEMVSPFHIDIIWFKNGVQLLHPPRIQG